MEKLEIKAGSKIRFNNKRLTVEPEIREHSCEGCAFYHCSCADNLTKICTNGFIFTEDNNRNKK